MNLDDTRIVEICLCKKHGKLNAGRDGDTCWIQCDACGFEGPPVQLSEIFKSDEISDILKSAAITKWNQIIRKEESKNG